MGSLEKQVADLFLEMADGIENGSFGKRPKVALTGLGGEHGEANALQGAVLAAQAGVDVHFIGTLTDPLVTTVAVADEGEGHDRMDEMLASGEIDAAVTSHYPFPIGVSTVGRVVTPAFGKEMFIATTTGTASADRIEAMIMNALYGIIVAKACGKANPTVGILNIDGARQTESALRELAAAGYPLAFAESSRADGGAVLRGNDVLQGTPDVLVCDSLTGNVITKMLSSFTTGGSYEATGFGYGPGIGKDNDKIVLIVSRASGAPVIAQALQFAGQLVRNNLLALVKREFAAAEKAGLAKVIAAHKTKGKAAGAEASSEEGVVAPPAEPCPASIPGIEVMDLEDAVRALWKAGIYAESGMGCTGPLVMMSEANFEKAREILQAAGFIG